MYVLTMALHEYIYIYSTVGEFLPMFACKIEDQKQFFFLSTTVVLPGTVLYQYSTWPGTVSIPVFKVLAKSLLLHTVCTAIKKTTLVQY